MLRWMLLALDAYRNRRAVSTLVDGTRRGTSLSGVGGGLLGFVSGLAGRRNNGGGDFREYLDFIAADPASPPELSKMLDKIESNIEPSPEDGT